jgi:hypothetical protein
MTADAMTSINEFRTRQLAEANEIISRASQFCERVLASQGDTPDANVLQLQHDCANWSNKWSECPVDGPVNAGPVNAEQDYERAMG